MSKVQVLMSTYNGEKYFEEQLHSILNQSYANLSILIRDDGSKDNTVSLIQKFVKMFPDKIQFINGSNVGVIPSFYALLQAADIEASYICFCDQDDVWMNDKVERAVQALLSSDMPGMYFSSTMLADQDLNPLKIWPSVPLKKPSFYNALVQNIAVGATVVINKSARELIVTKVIETNKLQMHDWWAYLCISAFGNVYYDEKPTIYYRQHLNNVVGGHQSIFQLLRSKWKSFRKHSGQKLLKRQALEFERLYSDQLDSAKLHQLQLFTQPRPTLSTRIQYIRNSNLYRQSKAENLLFKFLILIDYI
ncbi:glycosyltransferase family 2 protein [Paenibacillus sp.]|uniref:glycosyltransferase family 2 protein n=1 Tax=Paenibacillus sp. TaxID=58172 RepID=UPI0028B101F4|nr:glycosyltransferase family 2 protein [Paenibacillus sp.]